MSSSCYAFPDTQSSSAGEDKDLVAEPYTWDNVRGWRRYRVLRPGRGMYHDIRRRLPYYWSDITDAFTYRTAASTIRMYFVKLVSPFPRRPQLPRVLTSVP